MDKAVVRDALEKGNYKIVLEKRYKTHAWRFKLSDGTAVFCEDKNKVWCQGKNKEEVEAYLDMELPAMNNDKVFIAYGRDEALKEEVIELFRKWDLEPLAINSLPTQGRTIIEQLEKYIPQANFGVVLATPDDIGYLVGEKDKKKYRARQNVVLELGMLFSKLGRKRVAIVQKKCDNFEKPSDIDGLITLEYSESVREVESQLKRELKNQGYFADNN